MEGNTTLKPKQKKRILETVPYISIGYFSRLIGKEEGISGREIRLLDYTKTYGGYTVLELPDRSLEISTIRGLDKLAGFKCNSIIVDVRKSKLHYGWRKWFCCPECGVKTGKLYLHSELFLLCRDCSNLTYASTLKKRPRRKKT